MKKLQQIALMLFMIITTATISYGQNYKQQFPSIDASGKITDENGKHIGWITTEGTLKDSAGVKIAHIDSKGNLVDAKSGKNLGKAAKNGNFVYHTEKSGGIA